MEGHGEALVIVVPLPGQQSVGRRSELGKRRAAPKFFFVDTMTAFDLAVLFRTSRLNVTQLYPRLLDGERKGEREFGAVVDLEFPDRKRECGLEGGEERMAGPLILLGVEAEDPVAGAVIDGGVLEVLSASHADFFDIDLHAVSRSLAAEECQLPWTPLGLAAEWWVAAPVADAANRGGGDPDPMHAFQPDSGTDCPILEVAAGVLNQRDG